jgi:PPOX class probable F420-dependent enzyme
MPAGHFTELTDSVREFLAAPRFAVAATINADGTPQQTVVWYELRGDRIMLNMRESRLKTHNLRRDPRISVCVEDGYHYVTLRGTVEFDDDQGRALEDIRGLAIRYYGPEKGQRIWEDEYSKYRRVSIYLTIKDGYLYEE